MSCAPQVGLSQKALCVGFAVASLHALLVPNGLVDGRCRVRREGRRCALRSLAGEKRVRTTPRNPSTLVSDPLDLVFVKHGGSLVGVGETAVDACKVPFLRLAEAHLVACGRLYGGGGEVSKRQLEARAKRAALLAHGCCTTAPTLQSWA